MKCEEIKLLIAGYVDGELPPPQRAAVGEHVSSCPLCGAVADDHAGVKKAVGGVSLPLPPQYLSDRLLAGLNGIDRARRKTWFFSRLASAAAVLMVAAVILAVFVLPGAPSVPDLLASSVELHKNYVEGKVGLKVVSPLPQELEKFFHDRLGRHCNVPSLGNRARLVGASPCCLSRESQSSPWIIYTKDDVPISLVIFEGNLPPLRSDALHKVGKCECAIYQQDGYSVLVCRSDRLAHLWISRMEKDELMAAVHSSDEGKLLFEGVSISVEGMMCGACSTHVEAVALSVAGVEKASARLSSGELIVAGERLNIQGVIDALKKAGYNATIEKRK